MNINNTATNGDKTTTYEASMGVPKKREIISNVVPRKTLLEVTKATLESISDIVSNSFGPMGSNTVIAENAIKTEYTKDGHKIIKSLKYVGIIEETVKETMVELTRNIVNTVGDGTTSAAILSSEIFNALIDIEKELNLTPYQLMKEFEDCVKEIEDEILSHSGEVTIDNIYDICMISTNGNELISENIKQIYEKFGNNVFIDVNISNDSNHKIKEYDGMTLDAGYCDLAFVNTKDNTSEIRDPRIYIFEDPIDTPEMVGFLDTIILKNILEKGQSGETMIPTVIMAPMISRDLSTYMQHIITSLVDQFSNNPNKKPPLNIITNIHEADKFYDISTMCGAKMIKKYIDLDLQEKDISLGHAPSLETICDWCGSADLVISDSNKTKFINPRDMFNENHEHTNKFTTLIEYLELELQKAIDKGENKMVTGTLKRRINSLKCNLVEYLVGGLTIADRDAVMDLVEDAVLNCRSAAKNGYGFGSNVEGLLAINILKQKQLELIEEDKYDNSIKYTIINTIEIAYINTIKTLFKVSGINDIRFDDLINEIIKINRPFNVKTGKFDNKVISSIMSDVAILETVTKLITLMFTSNQYICPSVNHNQYR